LLNKRTFDPSGAFSAVSAPANRRALPAMSRHCHTPLKRSFGALAR
jgi:hypothetical protein